MVVSIVFSTRLKKYIKTSPLKKNAWYSPDLADAINREIKRVIDDCIDKDTQKLPAPADVKDSDVQLLCVSAFKNWIKSKYNNDVFNKRPKKWLSYINKYIIDIVDLSLRSEKNKVKILHLVVPKPPTVVKEIPEQKIPTTFKKKPVKGLGETRKHYTVKYTVQLGNVLLECEMKMFTAMTQSRMEKVIENMWHRAQSMLGTPDIESLVIDSLTTDNTKEVIDYGSEE